jgi:hypothetical protein
MSFPVTPPTGRKKILFLAVANKVELVGVATEEGAQHARND